jgi:hypothetical protein
MCKYMVKSFLYTLLFAVVLLPGFVALGQSPKPLLIAPNGRYFMTSDGQPFFWLGDTGWLLFSKLRREEAVKYLDDRKQKGFNVIQVMVLHTTAVVNAYGDTAVQRRNVAKPITTPGNNPDNAAQYDYWDHVDFIVNAAAERGIYIAMVPIWGSEVKAGRVSVPQAKQYATFLANRYKNKTNIVWLNGGDIKGTDGMAVWKMIGTTLNQLDPNHLITFHPRGRYTSSDWFHNEPWLDFNMFQSGHRRYDQDTTKADLHHFGEDNYKYIALDYEKKPAKPTFDGEPSYENIPHGLHDFKEKLWNADDVRRYAYWSVFAGGCGFTYGDNAVMQMHRIGDKDANYGVKQNWYDAINDPGAGQMQYLKKLVLSKGGYFDRLPDQSIIAGESGEKYDRLVATSGYGYAMVYTYTGRNIQIKFDYVPQAQGVASWYNPRTGESIPAGNYTKGTVATFDPPGEPAAGNDWVLVIDWSMK